MGMIMEEKCKIRSVKFEPNEVIIIDDFPDPTQVALKKEPRISPNDVIIEVKSEFQGQNDSNPNISIIKQEIEPKEEQKPYIDPNNANWINPSIKFELKSEEIQISDYEDEEPQEIIINPYTCNVCGYNKATCREALSRHLSIHVKEKQYKCSECDYSTNLRDIFQTHMLNHNHIKHYECGICDFTSIRKDKLEEHVLLHTGEEPFNNIVRRKRIEKPFKCEKCEYGADTKNVLRRHVLLTHNNGKLLECHNCGHKTPSKGHLRQHVRIHFPNRVKSFQCNACKNRFLHKASLLKHMRFRPCKPGHS